MADYYDTLGVARGASEKHIRTAFRKLARKHHPDVNDSDPASEEKFKEINEAYTVLSDADSRRKYDRYGDDWKRAGDFEQSGFSGGRGFSHFNMGGVRHTTGRGRGLSTIHISVTTRRYAISYAVLCLKKKKPVSHVP